MNFSFDNMTRITLGVTLGTTLGITLGVNMFIAVTSSLSPPPLSFKASPSLLI